MKRKECRECKNFKQCKTSWDRGLFIQFSTTAAFESGGEFCLAFRRKGKAIYSDWKGMLTDEALETICKRAHDFFLSQNYRIEREERLEEHDNTWCHYGRRFIIHEGRGEEVDRHHFEIREELRIVLQGVTIDSSWRQNGFGRDMHIDSIIDIYDWRQREEVGWDMDSENGVCSDTERHHKQIMDNNSR